MTTKTNKFQKKAREAWREIGKKTRVKLLDFLMEKPGSSSYEMAKQLGFTPAGIKHHLDILVEHGKVRKTVHLLGNKGIVNYFIGKGDFQDFYLSDIEQIGWRNRQRLQLYLKKYDNFLITSKKSRANDRNCVIRTSITLLKDENGFFVRLPENIVNFYGLNDSDAVIEQVIDLLPYPEIIISITHPKQAEMINLE
ncbi:MAG: winged helix-turn-helix transcriptional regulator [Deltaproteobacteria bacterium]|nr:winged helix-turn-helix transcriptional regulator [Deltaproteobacteria bacterium]